MYRDPKTGFARRKSLEEGGEILVQIPSEAAFVGYVSVTIPPKRSSDSMLIYFQVLEEP